MKRSDQGGRYREIRVALGLSQEGLGRIIGVDGQTVSLRERGKVCLTQEAFLALEAIEKRRRDRSDGDEKWRLIEIW